MLHQSFGIDVAQSVSGAVIRTSGGREVPTRLIAERHVLEDLGRIPTLADWLRLMDLEPRMRRATPHLPNFRLTVGVQALSAAVPAS